MVKKEKTAFISTSARIALSDWPTLVDLIVKHAVLIKEQQTAPPEKAASQSPLPQTVDQRQIEEAINGPVQRFFKCAINAYITLSRFRMTFTLMEDENFRNKRAELPEADQIPPRILEKITLSDINKTQKTLDPLMTEQAQQWETFRIEWTEKLIQRLQERQLTLSEIERKEWMDPEPISELLNRFITLNIPLPAVKLTHMNFSKYFTLKANIAIYSALSRQHLPNDQAAIKNTLSLLKKDFQTVEKEENEIFNTQKSAIEEMMKPFNLH